MDHYGLVIVVNWRKLKVHVLFYNLILIYYESNLRRGKVMFLTLLFVHLKLLPFYYVPLMRMNLVILLCPLKLQYGPLKDLLLLLCDLSH